MHRLGEMFRAISEAAAERTVKKPVLVPSVPGGPVYRVTDRRAGLHRINIHNYQEAQERGVQLLSLNDIREKLEAKADVAQWVLFDQVPKTFGTPNLWVVVDWPEGGAEATLAFISDIRGHHLDGFLPFTIDTNFPFFSGVTTMELRGQDGQLVSHEELAQRIDHFKNVQQAYKGIQTGTRIDYWAPGFRPDLPKDTQFLE